MDADTSLFRLEQTAPRLGESLRVGLEFPGEAPWLKAAARVGVRLEGQVEYRGRDGEHRRRALPGSEESTREGALMGTPRLSFTVTVPDDVPPSHESEQARVEWVLLASLYDEKGAVVHEERRLLRVMPRRTRQLPVPREPPVPQAAPKGFVVGFMLVPAMCCILPGLVGFFALLARPAAGTGGERTALMLGAGALLLVGVTVFGHLLGRHGSVGRVRVLQLEPLAESFPLGATARLRLYLDLAEPLTVREAELRLCTQMNLNNVALRDLLTRRVPLSLPTHLSAGWHAFDVEVPVPPDFLPGHQELLKPSCTVVLHAEEQPEALHCTAPVRITPEVLEPATAS